VGVAGSDVAMNTDPDDDWTVITSFANLRHATTRAARGKRANATIARFLERREPQLLALQGELRSGAWRPGVPTVFTIRDPKPREITAAPFIDRVVHHALIGPLEERFDAALCPETFACRRGKGTHRALDHAQACLRSASHFLKLDIARCFPSIQHEVVRATLAPFGLGVPVLEVIDRLLAGPDGTATQGLPIGSLTSQWFANLVLGRLDRFVADALRPSGYVRYMDDCVLFADGKSGLREAHGALAEFVRTTLCLELKERATLLAPAHQGLPFLGWRLYRGTRRIRPENLARCRARLKSRRAQHRAGVLASERYLAAVRAHFVHLGGPETIEIRSRLAAQLVVGEHEMGAGPAAPRTARTAAAVSTTPPRTRAPRIATATRRRTATRISGSVPPKASHA